ncbi:MAG: hypothetical protein ACM32O_11990 [Clostridia bacterium]
MKILSVTGEQVPPGKGGSPSDTFDRSIASFQAGKETKNVTVTYCRYFGKALAEQGIYDEEQEGIPVNKLAAILYLEKNPDTAGGRQYYNETAAFLKLFEGFSLSQIKQNYGSVLA